MIRPRNCLQVAARWTALSSMSRPAFRAFSSREESEASTATSSGVAAVPSAQTGSSAHAAPPSSSSTGRLPRKKKSLVTRDPASSRSGYQETVPLDALHGHGINRLKIQLGELTQPLRRPEVAVINNLVGCFTKHGKKAVAQKIVLEAMSIMRTELARGAAAAAAESAAKETKAGEAAAVTVAKKSGRKAHQGGQPKAAPEGSP